MKNLVVNIYLVTIVFTSDLHAQPVIEVVVQNKLLNFTTRYNMTPSFQNEELLPALNHLVPEAAGNPAQLDLHPNQASIKGVIFESAFGLRENPNQGNKFLSQKVSDAPQNVLHQAFCNKGEADVVFILSEPELIHRSQEPCSGCSVRLGLSMLDIDYPEYCNPGIWWCVLVSHITPSINDEKLVSEVSQCETRKCCCNRSGNLYPCCPQDVPDHEGISNSTYSFSMAGVPDFNQTCDKLSVSVRLQSPFPFTSEPSTIIFRGVNIGYSAILQVASVDGMNCIIMPEHEYLKPFTFPESPESLNVWSINCDSAAVNAFSTSKEQFYPGACFIANDNLDGNKKYLLAILTRLPEPEKDDSLDVCAVVENLKHFLPASSQAVSSQAVSSQAVSSQTVSSQAASSLFLLTYSSPSFSPSPFIKECPSDHDINCEGVSTSLFSGIIAGSAVLGCISTFVITMVSILVGRCRTHSSTAN